MAFQIKRGVTTIKVVLRSDDAVTCDDKQYMQYIESFREGEGGNEAILELNGEPTRFVINTRIDWETNKKIQGDNVVMKDDEMRVNPYIQKAMLKACFKGVEGAPPELKVPKDRDGTVAASFLTDLDEMKELGHLILAMAYAKQSSNKGKDSEKNF